jgi:O-antigen/teichoic acid export membrane protein
LSAHADELRRLGRRAFLVNLGWVAEAFGGLLFVGYAARVIAPADYGVLVFATSLAGLLMLLDLGTTGVLVPAFVRESVHRRSDALATLFRTSLAALAMAGVGVVVVALILAGVGPRVIRAEAFAGLNARVIIVLFGTMAAIALPARAYELLFEAHARFGMLALARTAAAVARLVASVVAVHAGFGVIGIAIVAVVVTAVRFAGLAAAARLLFPEISAVAPHDWSALRALARSAGWAAIDNTSRQIMMMSDAVLLAFVAPVQAVALYGIGSRVPLLAWNAAGRALGVSMQAASEHTATGNDEGVRDVFRSTVALAVTVVWPILVVLIAFSEPFLRAWAGAAYVGATPTMRWLAIAGMAFAVHAAAHAVLYARNRIDVIARITVVEGVANVALSLILGSRYGAPGPAFATALTVTVATWIFFVPAACREIRLPFSQLMRDLALKAVLPIVVVATVAVVVRQLLPADRPLLQCVAAGALALLCIARLPFLMFARSPAAAGASRPIADAG